MANMRPIPFPTPDTKPYWDAAHGHHLAIQRCQSCRTWFHPPEAICMACGGETLAFENTAARGRVYTYSVMYDKRVHGFEDRVPYIAVWVELPEQPKLLVVGNLLGVDPADVKIGMAVKAEFEKLNDDFTLIQFRPEA